MQDRNVSTYDRAQLDQRKGQLFKVSSSPEHLLIINDGIFSYRQGWFRLDCAINCLTFVQFFTQLPINIFCSRRSSPFLHLAFFFPFFSISVFDVNMLHANVVRALRLLKSLRYIKGFNVSYGSSSYIRLPYLLACSVFQVDSILNLNFVQLIFQSVRKSAKSIVGVLFLQLFFLVLFGITGMNFFAGKLTHRCIPDGFVDRSQETPDAGQTFCIPGLVKHGCPSNFTCEVCFYHLLCD